MSRRFLTDKGVAALKAQAKRYAHADPELRRHYVLVQPNGIKTYTVITRGPDGKQKWHAVGGADLLSIEQARERARDIIKRVHAGDAAKHPKTETLGSVVALWRKRHVEANRLRSANEINRLLDRHVLPEWQEREFVSIRRSEINALLDRIEDDHGQRQAHYVLGILRQIMTWYAGRSDDYSSPIIRGMARRKPSEHARDRILGDAELRAVWKAAGDADAFGALVRMLLLTGQRLFKVRTMRRAAISKRGVWTIPVEDREKGHAESLLLPQLAQDVIAAQPDFASNPFVFAVVGEGPIGGSGKSRGGLSKFKGRFDEASGVSDWTLHDLRRTARSLMSRAGVNDNIAERVLGHEIGGVKGVYDRHDYFDEKADALNRLAALIKSIIDPQANVVAFERPAKNKRPAAPRRRPPAAPVSAARQDQT